jgi:hypothetical protein
VAIAPVAAGVQWQQRHFAGVNTHNLVYTAVLPDVGGAALGPLGLPPAALSAAGRAYYPNGVDGLPGAEVVAADPAAARSAAYGVLLAHPAAAAGALGRGLTATLGAGLSYLPSAPVTPASVPAVLGTTVGPQGADRAQLLAWLDGLALAVVARHRRGGGPARRGVDRAASRGAAAGCGRDGPAGQVAAVAAVSRRRGGRRRRVLGDGYFEIAKHVWLAAYLLVVTAAAVAARVAVMVARRTFSVIEPRKSPARARLATAGPRSPTW